MTEQNESNRKTPVNVNFGKEIDAALGDVVRGLLKRPSEEIGNLVAEGIGILGDRVRRKRELNAELGLREVRETLDARNIDIEQIEPPDEEELHLLVNGLSLSGDGDVRALWAGLFAMALDPDSGIAAERPFISVLQSLSPLDARIVDFLAFTIRTDEELILGSERFVPSDPKNVTAEEKAKIEKIQNANSERQKAAIQAVRRKAEEYALADNAEPSWSENLLRQGVIERVSVHSSRASISTPRFGNERDLIQSFTEMQRVAEDLSRIADRNSSMPKTIFLPNQLNRQLRLEVQFSTFGRRFAKSCGLL